jgi:hypothetical protein
VSAAAASFGDGDSRQVTALAEGVYAIQHRNSPDGNPSGNTAVIIGDREVFVMDSTYQPSLAREDIAQIRQWTDKPAAYLPNSTSRSSFPDTGRCCMTRLISIS